MEGRARDLDAVEFLSAAGGWPIGTVGTVVAEDPETALVEVNTEWLVDEAGLPMRDLMDDLVDVPYEDLRVIPRSAPLPG
jgi:hypothetical protein